MVCAHKLHTIERPRRVCLRRDGLDLATAAKQSLLRTPRVQAEQAAPHCPETPRLRFFRKLSIVLSKNLEAAPLWQIWLSAGGSPAWKPPPQQQHLERKCMPIAAALGIAEGRLWPPLLREPQEQLEAEDHQRASLYPTCSRPRHVLQALRPTLQTWG